MPHEPSWILILVYLAGGFLLLAKGADWLVGGSAQIARRVGVSTLVVGLTVVAFGTSMPEIVVSGLAASEGKVDLSLGNVLGSNVANVGLVLGASAVVLPRVLESRLPSREVFWLFLSLGLLWFVSADRAISRHEGLLLLGAFVVYNAHVLLTAREGAQVVEAEGHYRRPALWAFLGIVAVVAGAKLVVVGASAGALAIGIPASVVGLTIVAVGTSLPELAAGLGGAFRGESDISLGNVVGSNVFNVLAVIGIVAMVRPMDPGHAGLQDPAALERAFGQALHEDFFVVLGFSLAAIALPHVGGARGGRFKGALLIGAYVVYCVWLFRTRSL